VITSGQNGFTAAAAFTGVGSPRVVAVGDFNGDGKPDMVATDFVTNKLSVLLGNGDGTFQAPVPYVIDSSRPSSAPFGVVVGDFNGDGRADIAAVNGAFGIGSVAILLGNGDGTFRPTTTFAAGGYVQGLATADFNGDGAQDLVATDFGNNAVIILLGNGDGTFRSGANYPAGTGPTFVTVADCNGDGFADLLVATSAAVELLLGNGDGTFKPPVSYPAGKNVSAIAVADFNGDGRADLAVANGADNNLSILLGNGDGTFKAPVNYPTGTDPAGITSGDFNGDGLTDLAVANANSNNVSILLGKGDGSFQAASNYNTGGGPVWPVVADFNGDGRSDLAVATYYSAPSLSVFLGAPGPNFPAIAAVVNGATFTDTGLSPGLIFTVAGVDMGPADGIGPQLDSSGRVSTNVLGVQVLVAGYPAPLLYVRQDQINAVVPYEISTMVGGNIAVQVSYNGMISAAFKVSAVATAPAIFPIGDGQGAILNQDSTVNGPANPAVPGSIVSIYATGEGQTTPSGIDGQLVTVAGMHPVAALSVSIGGIDAAIQYQGSTLFDGFLQVNVVVPNGVASGNVPVVLIAGGRNSQPGITMAVR
jgi:uncharacterized protein (TIGR03437 family)